MSKTRSLTSGLIALLIIFVGLPTSFARQDPNQAAADQQKAQAALEDKALKLLEQVVSQAQALKLPENRIRVQFTAADLLWSRDESRARNLFRTAAAALTDSVSNLDPTDRNQFGEIRAATQLRQELVTAAADHDPKLALEILHSTHMPQPAQNNNRGPVGRQDTETSMEFSILSKIAGNDPKQVLQNAEDLLQKGQYSGSLVSLLSQLQAKDPDSATKLTEDIVKALGSEDITANQSARNLELTLLRQGPVPADAKSTDTKSDSQAATTVASGQYLSESDFRRLMEGFISAGLNANPNAPPANTANTPGNGNFRGGPGGIARRGDPNAMALLSNLSSLLPQIDKYLPARSSAVRQKLTESGFNTEPAPQTMARDQINALVQQGTVDSIVAAAPQAPGPMQTMLYQQAAMKALDQGDADRALKIAGEHLNQGQRDQVQQAVDSKQIVNLVSQGKMADAHQMLSSLKTDEERIDVLTRLVGTLQGNGNLKMALQIADEARNLLPHRAEDYDHLKTPLKVAQAYSTIDPTRSFEVLDPGISQINELLNAAAILNGFEVEIFKDDEMPFKGNSTLSGIIASYGQELAALAKVSFDGAQSASDKFQRSEAREIVKLAIARGILGGPEKPATNNGRNGGYRFGN